MRVSLLALFLGLLAVVSGQLDENEDMDKGIPENVQVKVAAADGAVVVGHAADANAAASGAGAVATNATASTGVVKFKCALCKLYFDLFKSQDSEVAKKEAGILGYPLLTPEWSPSPPRTRPRQPCSMSTSSTSQPSSGYLPLIL